MTSVVAYDIADNRTRARLARYLGKWGLRLQKSVFAVEVEPYQFRKFLGGIRKIVGKEDEVAVFRLCAGCKNNAIQQRAAEKPHYIF